MQLGKLSAARARQWLQNTLAYLTAKREQNSVRLAQISQRVPLGEWAEDYKGTALWISANDQDMAALGKKTAASAFEHQEAYCLARDYSYAQRSRQFLYTMGHQGRLRTGYELWAAFAVANPVALAKKVATKTPEQLATMTQADLNNL